MKSFKISFYKSDGGELTKLLQFFRLAEKIEDLVANPPQEFLDMLDEYLPLQGWAEMEENRANIYVVFTPRGNNIRDFEHNEFRRWLDTIKPADFKGAADGPQADK
ncbi:MAG: hypothetical protein WCX65_10190 [bacterium]